MSSHLLRLRLFQRHLRSLVWVWVWVWDWIHSHTSLRTRSPPSRHPPFTHYPFPPRSLVCGGQTSPHKPRLVVSHSTCPPLSSSPHAHSFVLGTAVINNNFIFPLASLIPIETIMFTCRTAPHLQNAHRSMGMCCWQVSLQFPIRMPGRRLHFP